MFKDVLKKLRKSKKITQDELADYLYVSRTLVTKWETGVRYPSPDNLRELANFFEVSYEFLVKSDSEAFAVQSELEEPHGSGTNLGQETNPEGAATEEEILLMAGKISMFLRTLTPKERDLFMRRYYYMEPVKKISGNREKTEETEKILEELRCKMFEYLGKESKNEI